MGSEEESRTPPLPQLSEDDQQYTPPKMIQSVVKIVQSKKVKKSDRSSKKKIKKHKKSTKHSGNSSFFNGNCLTISNLLPAELRGAFLGLFDQC